MGIARERERERESVEGGKNYRLYSRLRLRSADFHATDVFTLGKSLQYKPVR